ncbi:MAG: rhodanese-like domain-containing protein [Akkermansiaceae bacterium]|nr:rhodanese-like domain-containing protein [Akkermansiaceae bacterium]
MAKRSSTEHGERSSISLEDLFLKHQSGQVVVIDARHPWFFHRGHIAGATNVPSDEEFEPDALIATRLEKWKSAIAEGKTLVVYCDGLLCSDARTVSRAISKQGLDVSVFGGGWEAWKKANLPIESTSQEP